MKTIFLNLSFLFVSFISFCQTQFNFVGFGFYKMDYSNSKTSLSTLLQNGPNSQNTVWTEGFNHYEIDLDNKTFVHRYVGENEGIKKVSVINNLVTTDDYVKFDINTEDFGNVTCLISLNTKFKSDLVFKYKSGNTTKVAFF